MQVAQLPRKMMEWMRLMFVHCAPKSAPPHFVVNVIKSLVLSVMTHILVGSKLFMWHNISLGLIQFVPVLCNFLGVFSQFLPRRANMSPRWWWWRACVYFLKSVRKARLRGDAMAAAALALATGFITLPPQVSIYLKSGTFAKKDVLLFGKGSRFQSLVKPRSRVKTCHVTS